jgi:hypothetical protein
VFFTPFYVASYGEEKGFKRVSKFGPLLYLDTEH